jgi:hypothetical protein
MGTLRLALFTAALSLLGQREHAAIARAEPVAEASSTVLDGHAAAVAALPAPPPVQADPRFDWLSYEQTLRLRLQTVRDEREQLVYVGRPEYFYRRRVGGYVGLGAGAVILGTTIAIMMSAVGSIGPHTGPAHEFSRGERVGYPLGAAFGTAVLATGLWALATKDQGNPHRARIDAMALEQHAIRAELKRARRLRKQSLRYYTAPELSSRGGRRFTMSFGMAL